MFYRECDTCDQEKPEKRHPPEFLTDIHTDFNQTWWQSVTMLEDVHTQEINLTVNLGQFIFVFFLDLSYRM